MYNYIIVSKLDGSNNGPYQEDEKDESNVSQEESGSHNPICSLKRSKIEVAQNETEQGKYCIAEVTVVQTLEFQNVLHEKGIYRHVGSILYYLRSEKNVT